MRLERATIAEWQGASEGQKFAAKLTPAETDSSDYFGISHQAIGAAIEVHRILGGPGLIESIYENALCYELTLRGLKIQRQLAVPVKYKGMVVKDPLFLDILVENALILEVKATENDSPIYHNQLLTYLRLTGIETGLIINFGKPQIKDGITRVVNTKPKH